MSFHYSPKIVTDGLVLYLDAANPKSFVSGATAWNDLTPNKFSGVFTNGPTYSSSNLGGIVFDGVNDYINLGVQSELDILNFTIIIWAKFNTFTDYQNLIFKGVSVRGQYGIGFNSSGDWAVQPNTIFIGDPVQLNEWNCFVGTYDGTNIRAYRNGVLKTNYVISQGHFGTITTIGTDISNGRYFNGSISSVKMYNRPLTQSEITTDFNALKSRFGL